MTGSESRLGDTHLARAGEDRQVPSISSYGRKEDALDDTESISLLAEQVVAVQSSYRSLPGQALSCCYGVGNPEFSS